ncbi:MAG: hypothetical protein MI742_00505 [Desulfobacterales bacterium]|nr:hypothetical protein [Desulfobacterales bacterium]
MIKKTLPTNEASIKKERTSVSNSIQMGVAAFDITVCCCVLALLIKTETLHLEGSLSLFFIAKALGM